MTPEPRTRRRTLRRSTAASLLTLAALAAPAFVTAGAVGAEPTVLTPIGGGYEDSTLTGFARAAAEGASGPTIDIVVVPAAYGDADKERKANLVLAQQRTDQVDAACETTVAPPFTGCTATLVSTSFLIWARKGQPPIVSFTPTVTTPSSVTLTDGTIPSVTMSAPNSGSITARNSVVTVSTSGGLGITTSILRL